MDAKQNILVIEDDKAIRRMLKLALEGHGYAIREATSASEGIREVVYPLPDLILLDLVLPDASGAEVLKSIREFSNVPVIVLSVVDSDESKIRLLDEGADDYLTKPFSVGELLARIRVALRHKERRDPEPELKCGGVNLDPSVRAVTVSGREVGLTPTEYAILLLLMQNMGRVLTREEVIQRVWGTELNETNALRVHLTQLRKKIASPEGTARIETIPGVGYRLVG